VWVSSKPGVLESYGNAVCLGFFGKFGRRLDFSVDNAKQEIQEKWDILYWFAIGNSMREMTIMFDKDGGQG
jgi:hypothetical protein